jgi:hypothetical protein
MEIAMITDIKLGVMEFRDEVVEVGSCFLFKRRDRPAEVGIKVATSSRSHPEANAA